MSFDSIQDRILSDFNSFLTSDETNQVNQDLILITITKLIFCIFKQFSQIPSLLKTEFSNLSNQLNNNNLLLYHILNQQNSPENPISNIKNPNEKIPCQINLQTTISNQKELETIDSKLNENISLISNSFNDIQNQMTEISTQLTSFLPIVEILISNNTNVRENRENKDHLIHIACKNGYFPIVKYINEKEKVDVNIKGNKQQTPLHYACENGHFPIVEYLITKTAHKTFYLVSEVANIEAKDWDEKTPLHYACDNGHLQIVEYLISKGANIDAKDYYERTPLICACENGDLTIVEYLLSKGANIEAKGEYEKTPLHYACEKRHLEIIEFLISKGANIESQCGYVKQTPLHYACKEGNLQVVELLLSKGANIEAKTLESDWTPLHCATNQVKYYNRTDVFKYLISKGANKYAKNKDGKTPYDLLSYNPKIQEILR